MHEDSRLVDERQYQSSPVGRQAADPTDSKAGPEVAVDPASMAGPVNERQRVVAIDVLRGFALLGILLLNIQSFALPGAAYMNPTAYGDLTGANYAAWWFSHVWGDQKFMTIFSALFGAGVLMVTQRAESSTGSSAAIHYRRMGWLIVFGLLHAHLLWFGDILYSYGMCGLMIWPIKKWPASVQFSLGLMFIGIGSGINMLAGWSMSYWPAEALQDFALEWQPPVEKIEAELAAYRGNWLQQVPYRSTAAISFETFLFLFWVFWRAGGLMLVGMALYQWGFFSHTWSPMGYLIVTVFGLILGVSLSSYGVIWNEGHNWSAEASFFIGSQWNYWGSLLTAMGMASGILMLCNTMMMRLMAPLAAVGRMALSNYFFQTLVCSMIFYGTGFGLFGALQRIDLLALTAVIWIIQMIASSIWLTYFHFGPMEWLWRTLSYWKLQPGLKKGSGTNGTFLLADGR